MKLAVVEVLRWYVVDQESSAVVIETDQNFEQGSLTCDRTWCIRTGQHSDGDRSTHLTHCIPQSLGIHPAQWSD